MIAVSHVWGVLVSKQIIFSPHTYTVLYLCPVSCLLFVSLAKQWGSDPIHLCRDTHKAIFTPVTRPGTQVNKVHVTIFCIETLLLYWSELELLISCWWTVGQASRDTGLRNINIYCRPCLVRHRPPGDRQQFSSSTTLTLPWWKLLRKTVQIGNIDLGTALHYWSRKRNDDSFNSIERMFAFQR